MLQVTTIRTLELGRTPKKTFVYHMQIDVYRCTVCSIVYAVHQYC